MSTDTSSGFLWSTFEKAATVTGFSLQWLAALVWRLGGATYEHIEHRLCRHWPAEELHGIGARSIRRHSSSYVHRLAEMDRARLFPAFRDHGVLYADDNYIHLRDTKFSCFVQDGLIAVIDSVPIYDPAMPYSGHYRRRCGKILVLMSINGHVLWVSNYYPNVSTADSTILRREFGVAGLPHPFHGRTLGDCGFDSDVGVVRPPNLDQLKCFVHPALSRHFELLMQWAEFIQHYRARIEHLFGVSGLQRAPHLVRCMGRCPIHSSEREGYILLFFLMLQLQFEQELRVNNNVGRYGPLAVDAVIISTQQAPNNTDRYEARVGDWATEWESLRGSALAPAARESVPLNVRDWSPPTRPRYLWLAHTMGIDDAALLTPEHRQVAHGAPREGTQTQRTARATQGAAVRDDDTALQARIARSAHQSRVVQPMPQMPQRPTRANLTEFAATALFGQGRALPPPPAVPQPQARPDREARLESLAAALVVEDGAYGLADDDDVAAEAPRRTSRRRAVRRPRPGEAEATATRFAQHRRSANAAWRAARRNEQRHQR